MRLDVLGSAGTYPIAGEPSSGYLVSSGNTTVLCDAGFGTFAELTGKMDPAELDAVVLSHRHPDHCVDLLALHHALAYGPYERFGLPVFCAPGVGTRLAEFLGAGEGHVFFDVFDFHEVGETNHVEIGSIDLRFAVTSHSVPTIAVRFEAQGRSLTYSADTGPGGGFPELAAGSNTILCEASIEGERDDHHFVHHLTAKDAGEIARAAGADRLILTHLPPSLSRERSLAAAEAVFGGETVIASPGDVYPI
jgi:ribonuclease BN (tRNA processing enzyme)